ncbi:hypothetical protein B7P43_G01287 [Cryptotermes secundus]|uniref:Mos1 transposase HTH domain-containing protein n=1 Tax=Cryptotermes secundus TaxID=105785 RepID=A0A2J7RP63_9NEOP|nr:hypothetical protein B7P43_G01287 [Cryptotermes secundus]
MDETYIHSSHTTPYAWSDGSIQGLFSPVSKGQRLIVIHAGGEQGFIPNAYVRFKSHQKQSCQKLGDTQAETIRKIQQAFGDDAMGVTQIKEWFNRFKHGRMSADSEQRSGRPSTSRNADVIEKVRTLIMEDRRLAIREVADEVGISRGSANTILTEDFGMRRVAAKFVPKLLSPEQQQLRLEVAQDMLECANRDPEFLKTVITGDESWVYGYDPETKVQASQWKHPTSPRPRRARQVRSNVKVILADFFDYRGVVHHEYAPLGQTVNKEYYQKSSAIFVMQFGARHWSCGTHATGSCIMTTPHT